MTGKTIEKNEKINKFKKITFFFFCGQKLSRLEKMFTKYLYLLANNRDDTIFKLFNFF